MNGTTLLSTAAAVVELEVVAALVDGATTMTKVVAATSEVAALEEKRRIRSMTDPSTFPVGDGVY